MNLIVYSREYFHYLNEHWTTKIICCIEHLVLFSYTVINSQVCHKLWSRKNLCEYFAQQTEASKI
jgi:hypothetical protein